MLSSTTLIRSQTAPHMLGYCRPPDYERKPQLKSRDNGHSPLVSYRPCVTYSFVPFSLPRPLSCLLPRIHSIFCFTHCPRSLLRSSFQNTNTSATLMIEPFFQTTTTRPLASLRASTHEGHFAIPSSQPFAVGLRHIHRSSHRLRPPMWLFGHSPLPKLT